MKAKIKVSYFFRKPSPVFHSIEEQFFSMQKHISRDVELKNVFASYDSKGFFRRFFIGLQAAFRQGEINHITGDIHFIAAFLNKKKTVLTIHDIGSAIEKGGLKGRILRYFWFKMPLRRIEQLTVISDFTKKQITEEFQFPPEKIKVIPDCVSDDFQFLPKSFNKEKPTILHIGTKVNKNLPTLTEALKGINCKLNIIGKLSKEQSLLLEKNKINFENSFNLPFEKIIEAYQKADIVSFVSSYEGFGVPVLEAQATGRPLITSNIPPMSYVAGTGALKIPPKDVAALRNAFKSLISDAKLRDKLVKSGLENVKKYTASAVARQYSELYQDILKK